MPITINTYCRVNRNGSININTDPTFPGPPYIGPICASGGVADGTYTFTSYQTNGGYTRPVYLSFPYGISNSWTDGRYIITENVSGDTNEICVGNTFPPPANPYLETSWTFYGSIDPAPITFTSGSCL
jgi:hypothetical protein